MTVDDRIDFSPSWDGKLFFCLKTGSLQQQTVKQLTGYWTSFLPRERRDAMHKRGLCRHAVSVCLSVRPSVCHVRGSCQNE